MAPTGAAAVNINGNTIHSKFRIPRNLNNFQDLKDEPLRKFQLCYKNLKFIIIDEMSMVGARLLHLIGRRCRDIFPNVNESFGGINVYMFGDFQQLPRVKDTPLYHNKFFDSMCSNGLLVFKTFEKIVELSVCHRQSSDIEFSKILDRVAIGEINDNDYTTLLLRCFSILRKSEQDKFNKAIHIFPTNVAVSKKKKNV